MDKYFYTVELNENGKKVIHVFGNIYIKEDTDSEKTFLIEEFKHLYISLEDIPNMLQNKSFYEFLYEKIYSVGQLFEEEALDLYETYFNGTASGDELQFANLTEDTPCGYYWSN